MNVFFFLFKIEAKYFRDRSQNILGKQRVIRDHLRDNKGENIQKQALFSFTMNN